MLDFICRFRLGWAPRDEALLGKVLAAQGVADWQIKESGLKLFHHRITIPLRDAQGTIVGFSARKIGDEPGPKYVNTAETVLFKKGQMLFGLDASRRRIAKERRVVIVEGQIDALRMIHHGFDYTVAGQGTAFGESQVRVLLQLGVKQAILMFDGDTAGQEAAIKVGHLLLKEGIEVRVVRLPEGRDPDSMLRRDGVQRVTTAIEEARDYLSFLVEQGSHDHSRSPAAKAQWVAEVAAKIREWNNPILIHESLSRLALLVGVPPDTVIGQTTGPQAIRQRAAAGRVLVDSDRILETDLLRWLVLLGPTQPQLVSLSALNYPPERIRTPLCQTVYRALLDNLAQGAPIDLLALAGSLDGTEIEPFLEELTSKRIQPEKADAQVRHTIEKLLERDWREQREQISHRISQEKLTDSEKLDLARQFDALKSPPTLKSS
jgi:DNA primase